MSWCRARSPSGRIRSGRDPQATGKSTAMGIHHWWRFRGGKICFYRGTEDTARTADMLSAG